MTIFTRGGWGAAALIALTLVAPLAALTSLAIVRAGESPLESASEPEPLFAPIEAAQRDRAVTVAIRIEYEAEWSSTTDAFGTVTTVTIASGDVVKTGTTIATVNNQQLVGYVATQPLWRDLTRGDTGTDVRVAQRLLTTMGFYSGAIDGRAGTATSRAIKDFNKAYGFGSNNGVLSLSSLVWAGPSETTVDEVLIAPGDDISPGHALFSTVTTTAAIVVSETPSVPRDVPLILSIHGVKTEYVAGSNVVTDPEFVRAVADALAGTTEAAGQLRLADPMTVGTVPAAATVTGPGGTCVFTDLTGPGTRVSVLGGTLGTVELDAELVGTTVFMNPREVRIDLECP